MQIPLDEDPPLRQTPQTQTPSGHVTFDACWEANSPLPPDRMTDACGNITLRKFRLRAVKLPAETKLSIVLFKLAELVQFVLALI